MAENAKSIKEQIDKLNFIKTTNFSLKYFIKRTKRQATDWDKIFSKHIFAKGLFKIYKKLSKKRNNSSRNRQKM